MSTESRERSDGARALLYTILGEFVLPAGGKAWTSTLVGACVELGINEKNARQALARLGARGRIEPVRHGRQVRWQLTPAGRAMLNSGAYRIREFGHHGETWDGQWLVAHCAVPEARRSERLKLRTQLAFEGFGELSASLAISPHVERERALRLILSSLDIDDVAIWRARTASSAEDIDLATRSWDLDALAGEYKTFVSDFRRVRPLDDLSCFTQTVEMVHQWRQFPSSDPELPRELLPAKWAGTTATELFGDRRAMWAEAAHRWFGDLEAKAT